MKKIIISPFSRKLRNGNSPNPKDFPWWKELIILLKQKDYYIIQIGRTGEEKIDGVDEIQFDLPFNKLKEMLDDCFTFISVDNFFHHFASYYGKKGIVIFGQSDPLIFGSENNINILKDRKYLRQNQFDFWENTKYNEDVFVNPEEIFNKLYKYDNGE